MHLYRKFSALVVVSLLLSVGQLVFAADAPTYRQIVETQVENLSQPEANSWPRSPKLV